VALDSDSDSDDNFVRRSAPRKPTSDLLLLDVCPLSLGYGDRADNRAHWVIPRNTTIPVKRTADIVSPYDGCYSADLIIVEGSRNAADANNVLRRLPPMSFEPTPKGVPYARITMDIDANGILSVVVDLLDSQTRKRCQRVDKFTVTNDKGRLSAQEIERMVNDAEADVAREQCGARLSGLGMNTTAADIRGYLRGVKSVDIDRCPATGMCLGTAAVIFNSAELVLTALREGKRTLPAGVSLEPLAFDAEAVWRKVDCPAQYFEACLGAPDDEGVPEEVLSFLGVSPIHYPVFASLGLASAPATAAATGRKQASIRDVMRSAAAVLLHDYDRRVQERTDHSHGVGSSTIDATRLPARAAALGDFLRRHSALSDGRLVYPYVVRPLPPADPSCVPTDRLDGEDCDADFDYERATRLAACSVQSIYSSAERPRATMDQATYAESMRSIVKKLDELHDSVLAAYSASVQRKVDTFVVPGMGMAPRGTAPVADVSGGMPGGMPGSDYSGPTVDEVD
jgi:hypothetical protein